MKKAVAILLLAPVLLLITGCPTGVDFPLGTKGTEKIEKGMIGTWAQSDSTMEVMKVVITKADDYSVKVHVAERGSMYTEETDDFTGWFTTVDGVNFIYMQDQNAADGDYYTYAYKLDGKTLKTYDISLKIGGVDAVTSTEAYRREVSGSLKMGDALSSETTWTKQ